MKSIDSNIWNSPQAQQLVLVLRDITDQSVLQNFLTDVLTEKEIVEISARLEAAKLLTAGEKYTSISKQTRLSSRTIARISEWLKSGKGGYQSALTIIAKHHAHLSPVRD